MAVSPRTIVFIVGGLVVVGAGFALAPTLGDVFNQSLAADSEVMGGPIEHPVNAAGETYGSPIDGTVPDLITARSDEGVIGYVRVSELDQQRNLAKSTTNPDAVFAVDVYESDGVTVVGSLVVTKDTPGARDGFNN